ncbi:MAG TPA: SGNH/GDSL hydrolase family protein [Candidatus Krumholzibacteria bacterium]
MKGDTTKKLLLTLATVVFTLLASEIAARMALVHLADEWTFLRYASSAQLRARFGPAGERGVEKITNPAYLAAYSLHRYLGYAPTPNYTRGTNRHNALGFRGAEIAVPKPANEFRIVCLGGSTTYTTELEDWHLAYPALLEQELRRSGFPSARVINAGAAGWASWESLANLEFRVLDLEPDLIVVYHGINDIQARFVWPPEAYRGDNSGSKAPSGETQPLPGLLEQSTIARYLLVRSGRILPHSAFQRTVSVTAPTYYGDLFQEQWLAKSYPQGIFLEVKASEMLEQNKPIYSQRNLENMVAIAHAHGVAAVLATFAYSPLFKDLPRVASEEYVAAYAEMNEMVRAVAEHSGASLFDFAAIFPQDPRYYTDGRHMNEEGSLLKAELFARYLIESHLLPPRT